MRNLCEWFKAHWYVYKLNYTAYHATSQAIKALAHLRSSIGTKALVKIALDEECIPDNRISACNTLGDLKDPTAVGALKALIPNRYIKLRVSAANALAELGQSHWRSYVIGDNSDFEAMGKSKDETIVQRLIDIVADSKNDDEVRSYAALGIGNAGLESGFQPLIKRLDSFSCKRRESVIEALGRLGNRKAIDHLVPYLDHHQPGVVGAAAKAIGALGGQDTSKQLLPLLVRKHKEIRLGSAEGLAKCGQTKWKNLVKGDDADFERLSKDCNPTLLKYLLGTFDYAPIQPEYHKARGYAIVRGLGRSRSAEAGEVLLAILNHKYNDEQLLHHIIDAIGELGGQVSTNQLFPVLFSVSAATRKKVANAMERCGCLKWKDTVRGDSSDFERLGASADEKTVSHLITLLESCRESDPALATSIVKGLAKAQNARSMPSLIDSLECDDPLRSHVIHALESIDPKWRSTEYARKRMEMLLGDIDRIPSFACVNSDDVGRFSNVITVALKVLLVMSPTFYNEPENHSRICAILKGIEDLQCFPRRDILKQIAPTWQPSDDVIRKLVCEFDRFVERLHERGWCDISFSAIGNLAWICNAEAGQRLVAFVENREHLSFKYLDAGLAAVDAIGSIKYMEGRVVLESILQRESCVVQSMRHRVEDALRVLKADLMDEDVAD